LVVGRKGEEDPGVGGGNVVEGFDFPVFGSIFENERKLGGLDLLALGVGRGGFQVVVDEEEVFIFVCVVSEGEDVGYHWESEVWFEPAPNSELLGRGEVLAHVHGECQGLVICVEFLKFS